MTQQQTLLTWADVFKLCVPFAFSLVLIWAKLSYENRRERKAKQAFLWRTISSEQPNFTVALEEFQKIAKAAELDMIRIVAFDVPSNVSTFADRLA